MRDDNFVVFSARKLLLTTSAIAVGLLFTLRSVRDGVEPVPAVRAPAPIASERAMRHLPSPEATAVVAHATRPVERRVRRVVHRLRTQLAKAIRSPRERLPDTRCAERGRVCLDERSRRLAAAITWPVRPAIARGGYGVGRLLARHDPDEIHAALEDVCSRSSDAEERIVALVLLETVADLTARPLSARAYHDLDTRPAPEIDLLLGRLERSPIPDAGIITDVSQLAVDPTRPERTRHLALRALGHPDTARALHDALARWVSTEAISRRMALQVVTPALVACGRACADGMEALMTGGPDARLAVYSALLRIPEPDRSAVQHRVLRLVPLDEPMTVEERDQLGFLLKSL
jgi:hypothetical protein